MAPCPETSGHLILLRDPDEGLALLRLIRNTPALCTRLRDKRAGWRPRLVEVLAQREEPRRARIVLRARVAAALECLLIATDARVEGEGRTSLEDLLDQAFTALTSAGRSL